MMINLKEYVTGALLHKPFQGLLVFYHLETTDTMYFLENEIGMVPSALHNILSAFALLMM